MEKISILSTKRLEEASKEILSRENFLLQEINFISVSYKSDLTSKGLVLSTIEDDDVEDIVFSSSNAVKAVDDILKSGSRKLKGKNIFCLAGKTRKKIEEAFPENNIISDARNAAELANEVVSTGITEVAFFCGNKRREELPSVLNQAGVRLMEVEVYETVEVPEKLDKDFDAILFFSPSAAESYSRHNQFDQQVVCFCIGETTAQSIKELGAGKIVVSPFPQEEKLIETLINYYKKR